MSITIFEQVHIEAVKSFTAFLQTTTTIMSRLPRRPTRKQSRRMASSLSLFVIAFIALICLCPVSVTADETNGNKKSEYGTVIGIGESLSTTDWPIAKLTVLCRFGYNVCVYSDHIAMKTC